MLEHLMVIARGLNNKNPVSAMGSDISDCFVVKLVQVLRGWIRWGCV